MSRPATVSVNLGAIGRNLALITERVAPAQVMAVVKADAYGHGLLAVARAVVDGGAGWIGVLDVASALTLRSNGIGSETRLFAWQFDLDQDFAEVIDNEIDLGISSERQLELLVRAGATSQARVHLKIDTGLHRGGALAKDWPALVAATLAQRKSVDIAGVWSHLAEASDAADSESIALFREAIESGEQIGARFPVRHIAASAPALSAPHSRFDLVRVGAYLYGISPGDGVSPASLGLEPAMTLTAPVVSVDGTRAIIGIGYGHGLSTAASGKAELAINRRRFRILSVDVDSLTVDVQPGDVKPDDTATLFGPGAAGEPTLQEWGDHTGTVGEEIVVRLSPAIPRDYSTS